MLAVLEAVAVYQPVGLSDLIRILGQEKSAIHRALTTLCVEGWIRRVPDSDSKWETTTHMLVVAHEAERRSDFRQRARSVLEQLHDDTGESVLLAGIDLDRVVTLDVVESSQLMRTVPRIGMVIPPMSAAGQAALAHIDPAGVHAFLGEPPSSQILGTLQEVRSRGWSLNYGDIAESASAVAAAVLDRRGLPTAVVAISAPTERMPVSIHGQMGRLVVDAARQLSP